MVNLVTDLLFNESVTQGALEALNTKQILKIKRVFLGVTQTALGVPVLPFQLIGRVFKHNQPYLLAQGLKTLQKAKSVSKANLGIVQLFLGVLFFPLQACGRVFSYRKPLLLEVGIKNLIRSL